jgi:hypothetical protein
MTFFRGRPGRAGGSEGDAQADYPSIVGQPAAEHAVIGQAPAIIGLANAAPAAEQRR